MYINTYIIIPHNSIKLFFLNKLIIFNFLKNKQNYEKNITILCYLRL